MIVGNGAVVSQIHNELRSAADKGLTGSVQLVGDLGVVELFFADGLVYAINSPGAAFPAANFVKAHTGFDAVGDSPMREAFENGWFGDDEASVEVVRGAHYRWGLGLFCAALTWGAVRVSRHRKSETSLVKFPPVSVQQLIIDGEGHGSKLGTLWSTVLAWLDVRGHDIGVASQLCGVLSVTVEGDTLLGTSMPVDSAAFVCGVTRFDVLTRIVEVISAAPGRAVVTVHKQAHSAGVVPEQLEDPRFEWGRAVLIDMGGDAVLYSASDPVDEALFGAPVGEQLVVESVDDLVVEVEGENEVEVGFATGYGGEVDHGVPEFGFGVEVSGVGGTQTLQADTVVVNAPQVVFSNTVEPEPEFVVGDDYDSSGLGEFVDPTPPAFEMETASGGGVDLGDGAVSEGWDEGGDVTGTLGDVDDFELVVEPSGGSIIEFLQKNQFGDKAAEFAVRGIVAELESAVVDAEKEVDRLEEFVAKFAERKRAVAGFECGLQTVEQKLGLLRLESDAVTGEHRELIDRKRELDVKFTEQQLVVEHARKALLVAEEQFKKTEAQFIEVNTTFDATVGPQVVEFEQQISALVDEQSELQESLRDESALLGQAGSRVTERQLVVGSLVDKINDFEELVTQFGGELPGDVLGRVVALRQVVYDDLLNVEDQEVVEPVAVDDGVNEVERFDQFDQSLVDVLNEAVSGVQYEAATAQVLEELDGLDDTGSLVPDGEDTVGDGQDEVRGTGSGSGVGQDASETQTAGVATTESD